MPVSIESGCVIGHGCFFSSGVKIASKCNVGSDVKIHENSFVGNNVSIGAGCRIGRNAHIIQGFSLGCAVKVGNDTLLGSGGAADGNLGAYVVVGNSARIEGGSYIAPNLQIAEGARIAAMTHVYQSVAAIESTIVILQENHLPVTIVKTNGDLYLHKITEAIIKLSSLEEVMELI